MMSASFMLLPPISYPVGEVSGLPLSIASRRCASGSQALRNRCEVGSSLLTYNSIMSVLCNADRILDIECFHYRENASARCGGQSHRLPGRIGNRAQWGFRPASTRDERPANAFLVTLDHRHRASTLVAVMTIVAARAGFQRGDQHKVSGEGACST